MDRKSSLRARFRSMDPQDRTSSVDKLGSGDLRTLLNPRLPNFPNHLPHLQYHVHHESTGMLTQQQADPYPFAPERDLTLLALRVAVLEKMASRIGVMAFIWATVVLLGGYVKFLKRTDFWIVSAIIFTEGARVFSRSRQLEWKQAASWYLQFQPNSEQTTTLNDLPGESSDPSQTVVAESKPEKQLSAPQLGAVPADRDKRSNKTLRSNMLSFRNAPPRSWWSISKTLPFIAHTNLFVGRHMSKLLYFLQLMSAFSSIVLSIWCLSSQSYVDSENKGETEYANLPLALNIFYALALTEAFIFLLERSYLEFNIIFKRILSQVREKCEVQDLEESLDMITDFFYDVYSKSLKGSIFDGLEMDLVGYSITEIQFDSIKKQFRGVRMLSRFVEPKQAFEADTLRRIGTTPGTIDRLVEMLTWKTQSERDIRLAAASIVDRLVQHSAGNCFKIVAVSGALEGIASLFTSDRDYVEENESRSQKLTLLGLRILSYLTNIRSNCSKIGKIRGLMPTIVSLIKRYKNNFEGTEDHEYQIFLVSLELIRSLATTDGKSGNALRDQIGRTVYLFQNLRDVLDRNHSFLYIRLREYTAPLSAIKILGSLALDDRRREAIGSTGGMIKNLLAMYQTREDNQTPEQKALRLEAGTALNLLVLQNPNNCKRIMDSNQNILTTLHDLLEIQHHESDIGSCAANILRTLFAYSDDCQRRKIAASCQHVMKMALPDDSANITKHQEAFLGFAARIVSVSTEKEMYSNDFDKQIFQSRFVKLVRKLSNSNLNLDNFPRIRRHTVELAIALMEKRDESFLRSLQQQDFFRKHLERMLQTMYDLEDFYTFSGLIGLTRHSQTLEDLIVKALQKLAPTINQSHSKLLQSTASSEFKQLAPKM